MARTHASLFWNFIDDYNFDLWLSFFFDFTWSLFEYLFDTCFHCFNQIWSIGAASKRSLYCYWSMKGRRRWRHVTFSYLIYWLVLAKTSRRCLDRINVARTTGLEINQKKGRMSQLKSVNGLRLKVGGRLMPLLIYQWAFAMTLPWRQHHKHCHYNNNN